MLHRLTGYLRNRTQIYAGDTAGELGKALPLPLLTTDFNGVHQPPITLISVLGLRLAIMTTL